ncbi:MAG: hypothetical protein EHM81_02605 [Chloroflexi bacterium]|nr:MAG: hypothetical protein EHM81_02605 [Chloroflexota bacterium]
MFKRLQEGLHKFFFPPAGSPRWLFILPYAVLVVLGVMLLVGGAYGWDYTNSPKFCGYTCHTMPPQNVTYLQSPHANVYCTECHIGRAFVGQQFARKSEDVRELYAMVFHTYEFPIRATRSHPARETCEKCHAPETFSDDSLRTITHFTDDKANTPVSTYLILKTGGGAKREGMGRGIHWHIVNKVTYYAADERSQDIPYVRVYNDDDSQTEYVDVESGFDPKSVEESKLVEVSCTTCHNRVSHNFKEPDASMDSYMQRKLIDPSIPDIHQKGVEVLSVPHTTQEQGLSAIAGLENYYKTYYADFYNSNQETVATAIAQIQAIYKETVFLDQKVTWDTHPNNLGHMQTAGCFRCHDGKHLDANQQAIRLECNLCHSIPVRAGQQDFVTKIEISRGPEPESHRNANWISLHNKAFDATCANCHTTEGAGSTTNTSFCSNSACHGSTYTYAGFDAPKLREILQAQLPTPTPAPKPPANLSNPTYDNGIEALFNAKCAVCHQGASAPKGIDVTTYAGVMKGGAGGAIIVPNDSANSILVQVQGGQHFATFSPEELALIKQWIDAGAPEK